MYVANFMYVAIYKLRVSEYGYMYVHNLKICISDCYYIIRDVPTVVGSGWS